MTAMNTMETKQAKGKKKPPINEFDDPKEAIKSGALKKVEDVEDLEAKPKVEIVGVDDGEESEIRKRILSNRTETDDLNFQMAEDLHYVYANQIFKKWNYESWEHYCEDEVGFGVRKANYLKKIWEWFAIEVNDNDLLKAIRDLGWNKAMMLTGLVNSINKDRWLEAARELSCKRLEEKIKEFKKENKGKSSEDDGEMDLKHRLSVDLYNEQVALVQEAMNRAGELANTDVKGQQLAAICSDYMATNEWMKDPKKSLQAYFAKFESLLGVKIVVVDPKSTDVVYGKAFLADMQNGGGATA